LHRLTFGGGFSERVFESSQREELLPKALRSLPTYLKDLRGLILETASSCKL
jgi:hypothetical protein